MKKIRKNSKVKLLCGKDKGKEGTVLAVLGDLVTVEGVNIVKKHVRPNPSKGVQGGIIEKTMPIHISNLLAID
jgi:large subunit ribosomal protein L24